jgi:hypothetical protein
MTAVRISFKLLDIFGQGNKETKNKSVESIEKIVTVDFNMPMDFSNQNGGGEKRHFCPTVLLNFTQICEGFFYRVFNQRHWFRRC